MEHLVCEILPTGDYIITTPNGTVMEPGTCKEESRDGKITINPGIAWAAVQRRFYGNSAR